MKPGRIPAIMLVQFIGVACLLPAAATAHVRWFVEAGSAPAPVPYRLSDPAVWAWALIAMALVATAVVLDRKLPAFAVPKTKVRHDVMELMRILTGMSLLLTAYDGSLIAPHLEAVGGFGLALVLLQAGIGLLLLSNHAPHYAAILLLLLFLGMSIHFGFVLTVEYVNIVGIALFILFNALPDPGLSDRLKPYSVDVLRIFTGLSLIILGVAEKLHPAALGQVFIADYAWNFMPLLGFDWFDDRMFVLSAGVMEVVFGTILVLGVVTRLNILAVAVFMLTSNIVFLIEGRNEEALLELIGHLPIIATALILLVLGSGQRLKVTPRRLNVLSIGAYPKAEGWA
ncbi:putative membrane protein YphA (DoxX/SURF4 family) [Rubricella aquisinus]|uniref:Putative membrane protein YphA (DoxX/SURF4 family) n=1 Tax=Rubricella aquisinus TaxID=2028108 RepID=A0A840WQZ9_9RHOB|nr:DoxX family membrane protein [Rubricella aquisinus]MBB5517161.1 putative membrane protein YphA (DoxX/SURF4 family) [Rubricella aquisinus]